MAKVCVQVTAAHFKRQDRGNCERCAVALALNDVLREPFRASVWFDSFQILDQFRPVTGATVRLPLSVRSSIPEIDRGETIEPFEFSVTIPDEFLRDPVRGGDR